MQRHLVGWLLWWIALFWLWMLLVGDWNDIEWIAGACAAAVAATVAELARTAARQPIGAPLERFRASALVLPIVFVDFAIVMYALFVSLARRDVVRGEFLERRFEAGPKTTSRGAAHRAWTILLASFSANAYVLDIDAERDVVLLHDLVPWRRSEEPA